MVIEPLGEGFAAKVSGVDLRVPLAAEALRALEAAIDACAALVFRGQALSDAQQIAFSEGFGPIENKAGGNVTRPARFHRTHARRACATWPRSATSRNSDRPRTPTCRARRRTSPTRRKMTHDRSRNLSHAICATAANAGRTFA